MAPAVIDALLARTHDPDSHVRAQLAHMLGKLTAHDRTHPGVEAALEQLVKDSAAAVREQAQASLQGRK